VAALIGVHMWLRWGLGVQLALTDAELCKS
jgi:hypothetical protein